MRLNIKATNITLSDATRDYLDKRLRTLDKLIDLEDPALQIDIELAQTTRHHQTGEIFKAEITLHRGKESFRAVAETESITASIDEMRDEIAREITSDKGKKESLSKRGGRIAKALLQGGYEGLAYLGKPARSGWKYVKGMRFWRKEDESDVDQ